MNRKKNSDVQNHILKIVPSKREANRMVWKMSVEGMLASEDL